MSFAGVLGVVLFFGAGEQVPVPQHPTLNSAIRENSNPAIANSISRAIAACTIIAMPNPNRNTLNKFQLFKIILFMINKISSAWLLHW